MKNSTHKSGAWKSYVENRQLTTKIIMRIQLLFLMILITAMHTFGNAAAQTVSLSAKSQSLISVLDKIESQTGYYLGYRTDLLEEYMVTVDLKNATIRQALDACFKNLPIIYKISDKFVTIYPKSEAGNQSEAAYEELKRLFVTGKVTDQEKRPIPGVTVRVKGTNVGTVTDATGSYRIEAEPASILTFTFTGYLAQEIKVGELTSINISLAEAVGQLNEVVAKGYYNTTRALNTGNVSIVKSQQIEAQPVGNVMQALAGRVSGLYISESSGIPGAAMNIKLRGQNSIGNGSDPLYIVDGVPFGSQSLYDGLNLQTRAVGNMSPFFSIRPADIESIEILKDADATAIYGSRGANGVILITTKKGRTGKTKVNFNVYQGAGTISNRLDLMNTEQYLEMRREAYKNDGTSPSTTDYDLNGAWDSTRYTDWQDVLIGNTAHITDAQGTISGGNSRTQFMFGAGYRRETTVFPGDYRDTKGTAHVNINHKSEDERLNANLSLSYVNDNNKLPLTDFTTNILLAPNAPAIYNPDGTFNWQKSTWANPFWPTVQTNTTVTDNLNASLDLGYKIGKFVKLGSRFGYNDIRLNSISILPLFGSDPNTSQDPSVRRNSFGNNRTKTWIIEPTASVEFSVGKSQFQGLLGTTFQQNSADGLGQRATGFASDALIRNVTAATTIITTGITGYMYRYNAFYGRLAWNYSNRYLLNVTARRDGSSRFGPKKRFGNFGAVGAAWIFTEEDLMKKNLPVLSFGKIRASYGLTGNDQLGNYKYLSTYTAFTESYQGGGSLTPTSLTNPSYGWETVKKLEAAIDLGFLKDRFLVGASWYRHRTGNQLVEYDLPNITGFPSVTANLPAVIENSGLELELTTRNIEKKDFTWTTSGNISFPKNELVSFPNLASSAYATQYVEGQSLFVKFRYHYTGVDPVTGVYTFEDINKDGDITNTFDRRPVFVGQKFFGGLNNSFSYKGFQLDVFFQFVKQTGFEWVTVAPGRFFAAGSNQKTSVIGDVRDGSIQRYTAASTTTAGRAFTNYLSSDGPVKDVSFVRLKNVQLSYVLPSSIVNRLKLQNVRIYAQGQNLLTFTKYNGLDPETTQSAANVIRLPSLRMFTAGIELSL